MSEPATELAPLRAALESGDISRIRKALRDLSPDGQQALAERLGDEPVRHLRRAARRGRETIRRASGGRVVVIHGIMGASLDVVDADGDSDGVWLNYWRLFNGRIRDLALNERGDPADPRVQVRVAGIFPEYLDLLMTLDIQWKVKPFAFDWRLDMDDSADRLAETIRLWANGEPCHIVAHSMGGLVSRHMIARYPDLWASMQDPDGHGRGGRLVMLGTPNRGSFAIPMVFTGTEPVVRKLEFLDRKHDMGGLLPILGSFPGSYQMLPAPGSGPGGGERDDRDQLFTRTAWATNPVSDALLARGREFQQGLGTTVDPSRMTYVAGYDQDTYFRIRITRPGVFEYRVTRNGDGRVPHELGELPGVRTLWVRESHGELPRNAAVLAGIHELLHSGNSADLEQTRPVSRGKSLEGWVSATSEDASEQELKKEMIRLRGAPPEERERQRLEAIVVKGFVGDGPSARETLRPDVAAPAFASRGPVTLRVQVVCGDITRIPGDVYCAGHYMGVLPQFAEEALDKAVSPPNAAEEDRVLRTLTLRGELRGELGDIKLYPWANRSGRMVAIAGMGHPGTFGRAELHRLGHALAVNLTLLPRMRTVCSVLIGSGVGNLGIRDALEGLLLGAADALRQQPVKSALTTLKIVERDLVKARAIREALEALVSDPHLAATLKLDLRGRGVTLHASGRERPEVSYALVLGALAEASAPGAGRAAHDAVGRILKTLPGNERAREKTRKHLTELSRDASIAQALAGHVAVVVHRPDDDRSTDEGNGWSAGNRQPTRYSCVRTQGQLQVATLADTAVIPQRGLEFDLNLFDQLARESIDPDLVRATELSETIARLMIPAEFGDHLRRGAALITELDRFTARLPWELMTLDERLDRAREPIAIRRPFARQLRTEYSPPPAPMSRDSDPLRALVIGDPGDPRKGHDLPGARREAIQVARFLAERGVQVEVRIGAPSAPRDGKLREYRPAGRLEVLGLLLSGRYALVHYCGHGDFDESEPERTGWVFDDGLLTAREIERLTQAPRLVVANACLSGRTSGRTASGTNTWDTLDESALLPSLADEFFRRGVRDYVGTAWEVSDEGAITFAQSLYEVLLRDGGANTLGDALCLARRTLYDQRDRYDALWAAYQHYGDPRQRLRGRS